MVPWPNLITGAVGVAGIGGTILAAWMTGKRQTANLKLSINAENQRARVAEKRRIYASCQASFNRLLAAARRPQHDDAELDSAAAGASAAVSELVLIAPDDIGQQAETIRRYLGTYVAGTAGGADTDAKLPRLSKQLIAAMRADLGEKP